MRRLVMLFVGGLVLSVVVACGAANDGGGGGDKAAASGETLRMGVSYESSTLDPDLLPIQQMWVYLDPIYDSLTFLDGEMKLHPQLATEWQQGADDQGNFLDMKLRTGLKFPDGADFNADTVIANVQRSSTLEGSTNAAWFAGITPERVADDTVRFRSEGSLGQLPNVLAGPAGMMISQDAIAAGADLSKEAFGIAPYSVKTVTPNRISYTKNDAYWADDVAVQKNLELVHMPDDAMLSAILAGDVHVAYLPYRMAENAEKAGFTASVEPGNVNLLFAVNELIKPFDNPKVREALSLALDRQSFCDSVWDGACTPASQFFGPRVPFFDKDAPVLPYDLEKAKALINEAGAQGASAEIALPAGIQAQIEMATYAQAQWKKIGLNVKVTQLPPPQVVARFTQEKNVPIAHGGSGIAFDPSIEIGRYVLENSLYNLAHRPVPEIDALYKEANQETDQDKRNEPYKKISTLALQNHLLIPVGAPHNVFIVSPKLQNWSQPWGANFNTMRGTWLSK